MDASAVISVICPGLSSDPRLATYIQLAQNRTSIKYFSATNYGEAVALRASHMWTLAQRNLGQAGAIQNQREGGLSLGFAGGKQSGNAMEDDLKQTHYGVQLLALIAGTCPAIGVVGSNDVVIDDQGPWDPKTIMGTSQGGF